MIKWIFIARAKDRNLETASVSDRRIRILLSSLGSVVLQTVLGADFPYEFRTVHDKHIGSAYPPADCSTGSDFPSLQVDPVAKLCAHLEEEP